LQYRRIFLKDTFHFALKVFLLLYNVNFFLEQAREPHAIILLQKETETHD